MTSEARLSTEELAALKETFRAQSAELLDDYGRYVLELERDPKRSDVLEAIQRVVHTLKGDSMSLDFDQLGKLAHHIEDLLASLRKTSRVMERRNVDLLLECGDRMSTLLDSYCSEPPKPIVSVAPLCRRLDEAVAAAARPQTSRLLRLVVTFHRKCRMHSAGAFLVRQRVEAVSQIHEMSPHPDGMEIEHSRYWTLVVETECDPREIRRAARVTGISSHVQVEPFGGSLAPGGSSPEEKGPPASQQTPPSGEEASTTSRPGSVPEQLRMDVGKIDHIMNLVGELVIGRSMVSQALGEISESDEAAVSRLAAANNFLERTLTELQSVVLKIRMVPVDHIFRRFPRVVRDLAHASGKEVDLEIEGASTELDKSIVDALHEPLLHLVRNAIDHGLEPAQARRKAGKPQTGRIRLAAFYEGNRAHILVEDDGRGISLDQIRERAMALDMVSRRQLESLHRDDLLNVIFQPGFSTRESVSTVSGRGIGMDVVRRVIENLKGTIDVNTEEGQGTRFHIQLPLTLAILKAILVGSAGRVFAIPLSGVLEIVRLIGEEAGTVLGKGVLRLRDRVVPLIDLKQALRLEDEPTRETRRAFVILAGEAERRVGLIVDRLLGEHELVVKPLEDPLVQSPGIAGASILGDGMVVLILNLRGLTDRRRFVADRT